MYVPPLRPRFELDLDCDAETVLTKIERAIEAHRDAEDPPFAGWVQPPYAELCIPQAQRHLWSPRLAIAVERGARPVVLHCRFGPEPAVWTGFCGAYAVSGLLALGGALIGFSQWVLNQPMTGAWLTLGGLLAAAGLYAAAMAGQRAGESQMRQLRRHLDLIIFECTIY